MGEMLGISLGPGTGSNVKFECTLKTLIIRSYKLYISNS